MRSPCCEDELFPLALPETDGPIVGKSREKVEPLSLSLNLPPKFGLPFSLPFPLSPNWLGEYRSQVRCPLTCTCPLLSGSLDYTLSTYPSTMNFHPLKCCHMSLMGPIILILHMTHGTSRATHHMPSVSYHSWCLKKREISIVSEFDEF